MLNTIVIMFNTIVHVSRIIPVIPATMLLNIVGGALEIVMGAVTAIHHVHLYRVRSLLQLLSQSSFSSFCLVDVVGGVEDMLL